MNQIPSKCCEFFLMKSISANTDFSSYNSLIITWTKTVSVSWKSIESALVSVYWAGQDPMILFSLG